MAYWKVIALINGEIEAVSGPAAQDRPQAHGWIVWQGKAADKAEALQRAEKADPRVDLEWMRICYERDLNKRWDIAYTLAFVPTQWRGIPPRHRLYCPSIPFFRSALGGFGPSHTEKSTGSKPRPAMVSFSLPLMAKVVPVPGT